MKSSTNPVNKTGVLLLNLGTPEKESVKAVRRFLKQFLDDPEVIDLPWILRKSLLYFVILPFRARKTAKAYAAIWDKEHGSALFHHSLQLAKKLQAELGRHYQVEIGMRYSKPSISHALTKLRECQKIIALPLFPQYSQAATGSSLKELLRSYMLQNNMKDLVIKPKFYNDLDYIKAKAQFMQPYIINNKKTHVIFSFHSLPVRQILKSNQQCHKDCFKDLPCPAISQGNHYCYRAQCFKTAQLIAEELGLSLKQYTVAFQSRLGKTIWIGPDLKKIMCDLQSKGIKDLIVSCPSFVADCLETLEEIGIRARKAWQGLGGNELTLVPSLNASTLWVKTIANWVVHTN